MVKICGRPINIAPETTSFLIDVNQWLGFQNQKVLFPWSGAIPEGWANKPVPNANSPKFVSVTGILASKKFVGTSKRFHVDIVSVTFLGSAPLAFTTQGEYSNASTTPQTDFLHSGDSNPQGETKSGDIF